MKKLVHFVLPLAILFALVISMAPVQTADSAPASSHSFQGELEIEPVTAYNLVVDSNVLSPAS
jgi:hypothetical protein